jgi:hypothetical protein
MAIRLILDRLPAKVLKRAFEDRLAGCRAVLASHANYLVMGYFWGREHLKT